MGLSREQDRVLRAMDDHRRNPAMTPGEKLAWWRGQPPSEERDYMIAAMRRVLGQTDQAGTQR
jgi:hypothetical protein